MVKQPPTLLFADLARRLSVTRPKKNILPAYIPKVGDYPPGYFHEYGLDKIDWLKAVEQGARVLAPKEGLRAARKGAAAFYAQFHG